MDFFELVEKRHSVRKFKKDIPPKEDIMKIINAARLAPSARNEQMWYFVAVYNDQIKKDLRLAAINKYDQLKAFPAAKSKQQEIEASKNYASFFADAPVVIAVFMKPVLSSIEQILIDCYFPDTVIRRIRPMPDIQSIGASIENILLASEALGYGACWMTAPLIGYQEMEKILGVDPEYHLTALIAFGKPDENTKQPLKKPIEEVLTFMD